jgi:hypothetical protein
VHPAGGVDRFLDPTPERAGESAKGYLDGRGGSAARQGTLYLTSKTPLWGNWRMTCLLGSRDEDAVACAKMLFPEELNDKPKDTGVPGTSAGLLWYPDY